MCACKAKQKKREMIFLFVLQKCLVPPDMNMACHIHSLLKRFIFQSEEIGGGGKKMKTTKTDFDRLKRFGLLFRRLTSLLRGFLWSCPQKTLMPGPKFPL